MEWAWAQLQFQEQVRMLNKIENLHFDESLRMTTACVFFLRFTHKEILDCPKYLRIDGVNVGCVFPYEKHNGLIVKHMAVQRQWQLVTEQDIIWKHMVLEMIHIYYYLIIIVWQWPVDGLILFIYCVANQWSFTLRSTCLWWRKTTLNCGCTGILQIKHLHWEWSSLQDRQRCLEGMNLFYETKLWLATFETHGHCILISYGL